MTQQLDHSREKLSRSRTERESNAAQRELEELRKLVRDREDEIGKVSADGEAARQQIDATEADHKKIVDELAARHGDISSNVGEAEAKARAKSAERDLAIKALPPQLFRRYDMIRSKRGTAIAQTTDGTCKACHMSLPPQLFHRLRREPTLEQCPVVQIGSSTLHPLRRRSRPLPEQRPERAFRLGRAPLVENFAGSKGLRCSFIDGVERRVLA